MRETNNLLNGLKINYLFVYNSLLKHIKINLVTKHFCETGIGQVFILFGLQLRKMQTDIIRQTYI